MNTVRTNKMIRQALVCACLILLLAALAPAVAQNDNQTDLIKQADALYQAQDWAKSAAAYERVTKADPSNGRAWFRLGASLHHIGRYDEAVVAYRKSPGLAGNSIAMYNLACSYAKLNKKDEAIEWLNKAIKAGFPQPAQLRTDTDLDSLRSDARFEQALALADKTSRPCEVLPEYKQFDFWVGEWSVENQQGQMVGSNTIQRITGNCILLENWTDGFGRTGKSMNFYDASKSKWRQTWVSDSGGISEFEGEYKEGAMRFTGEASVRGGARALQRLTFFNLDKDRVRQFAEQSTDGGKTWTLAYDLVYVRKK